MDHTGYQKLAGVLHKKMTSTSEPEIIIDFGEIQSNYSLKTNQFPIEIPPADYLVCRWATLKGTSFAQTQSGENVIMPAKLQAIKPGDRVLVVWNGSDPVVVDILYPATEVI